MKKNEHIGGFEPTHGVAHKCHTRSMAGGPGGRSYGGQKCACGCFGVHVFTVLVDLIHLSSIRSSDALSREKHKFN